MGKGGEAPHWLIQSAGIHPAFTISHYRVLEYLVYDSLPKQHHKHASFSRLLYSFSTQTPRQACSKRTHQSNTVSLIRSHIDGNYKRGKKYLHWAIYMKQKNLTYPEITMPPIITITLTWRFSSWFHSGFAFCSITFVHNYGEKQKNPKKLHPKISHFKSTICDCVPSSQRTMPPWRGLLDSFYCFLLQMPL